MRIVLDTNVFVSGVFFTGPPYKILQAWRDGQVQLLLSPAIMDEYRAVLTELSSHFPDIEIEPLLHFLAIHSEIVLPPSLSPVIRDDPSDDKFLECALAGEAAFIVSGDKHLLKLSVFEGIEILSPRDFLQGYL